MNHAITLAVSIFLAISLAGCTPSKQYREKLVVCANTTDSFSQDCFNSALNTFGQEYPPGFSLNIVEFDDQGKLFDRDQKKAVLSKLREEADNNNMLLVVFVHGWQNNAAPNNERLETFRKILGRIAKNEAKLTEVANKELIENNKPKLYPRKVAGVYLGWRGESVWVPGLKHLATFWDRKNTAFKIGHGAVTEVLSDLEKLISDKQQQSNNLKDNNLVIIGHSFGGLIVHNALTQILENRFVKTIDNDRNKGPVFGFGNLVVLINPAFEAIEMASFSDMSVERGDYPSNQLPVLAVLTSEADDATKLAFPMGRFFSTLFERTDNRGRTNQTTGEKEEISTYKSNLQAIGHFEPYKTHFLHPKVRGKKNLTASTSPTEEVTSALSAADSWRADKPGSKIDFKHVVLERTSKSAGRNPFMVIKVHEDLIPDHSDIDDDRILSFLGELVVISTTPDKHKQNFEKAN